MTHAFKLTVQHYILWMEMRKWQCVWMGACDGANAEFSIFRLIVGCSNYSYKNKTCSKISPSTVKLRCIIIFLKIILFSEHENIFEANYGKIITVQKVTGVQHTKSWPVPEGGGVLRVTRNYTVHIFSALNDLQLFPLIWYISSWLEELCHYTYP